MQHVYIMQNKRQQIVTIVQSIARKNGKKLWDIGCKDAELPWINYKECLDISLVVLTEGEQ